MAAATILFSDIVGFSKKPTTEQRRLVIALTATLREELRAMLPPPAGQPQVIALPTGDGMAQAFLHGENCVWDRATVFRVALLLHKWAATESQGDGAVSIRIGMHVGPVELVTDINGRTNVCGDTINYAQRIMDAANPRQTLLSDTAFREHVGMELTACELDPSLTSSSAVFQGPIEVSAKHGLRITVYKMTLDPPVTWGENADPVSKDHMLVSLTPLPKEIVGTFSERIAAAQEIAFVQLTGDRFLERLRTGEVVFSSRLSRFWVFMPDPVTYGDLRLSATRASANFVSKCVEEWKQALNDVRSSYPNADLKLGLFKEPPYYGASYVDWDRPGGTIHISPYVWGVPAPNCPGYDIQWIDGRPSSVYEVYVQGLRYLNLHSRNGLTSS